MTAAKTKSKSSGPKPIYAIHGEDAFLRSEALREVLAEVLGDHADPMAIVELEGASAALADVLDELRTPSLLTPTRVVILRDADPFISGRAAASDDSSANDPDDAESSSTSANRAGLEKYIAAPSETGVLILLLKSFPSNLRLHKLVASAGEAIKCEAPKSAALPGWVAARAKSAYKCEFGPGAADRLADLVGADCGRLDSELSKLATYVAPKSKITVEDVEELVGSHREEKVFAIGDAIARQDCPAALALWHQVLETDRAAPFRALGGLAWGFRRFVNARRMLDGGAPAMAAARAAGYFGDPNLFRRQVGRFSVRQWEDYLRRLLTIDVGTKTGQTTTELAVEKLIVQMCAAPAAKDRP